MSKRLFATGLVVAGCTLAGHIAAEQREATADPVELTADKLELDLDGKTAVLTGHVKLVQGPARVECSRVDVRYDKTPRVVWAKGSGKVIADVKGIHAEAPEIEIDLLAKTLELRGGVRLSRGIAWVTAERAKVEIGSGKVTMSDVKGVVPVPTSPPP